MKKLTILPGLLSLLLLAFSAGASADSGMTRADLKQTIDQMIEAVDRQDVDAFSAYFISDAKITIELPAELGGQTYQQGLADYMNNLRTTWDELKQSNGKYSHELRDIKITIDADGKHATVTDTTLETIEIDGQKMTTESDTITRFTWFKGVPKVSEMHGKVRLIQ